MKKIALAAALALGISSANALPQQGEELPLHIAGPFIHEAANGAKVNYFSFEGEFDENTVAVIDNFLDIHPEPVIFIANSGGGNAYNIVKAMDRVKQHGNVTFVTIDGMTQCMSACALVASAAKQAFGKFHFHTIHTFANVQGKEFKLSPYRQNMQVVKWYMVNGYPPAFAESVAMNEFTWLEVIFRGDTHQPVHMDTIGDNEIYLEFIETPPVLPEVLEAE